MSFTCATASSPVGDWACDQVKSNLALFFSPQWLSETRSEAEVQKQIIVNVPRRFSWLRIIKKKSAKFEDKGLICALGEI